jgi:tetratricopeptide (TPR) repeat protein
VLLGLLTLLLFAGTGAGVGYASGIQQRLAQQNQQVLVTAATHYNYGLQAMLQGNFDVARIQFEYVLKLYPDFPGLREKYTEVMVQQSLSNQPTTALAATATPDNRGAEALFAQAQQDVNSQNWQAALQVLETLRNTDKDYRTLDVDGLYYLALRFGGIEKILKLGDPEGGLYNFTLASRFAPLDHDALNYAGWARNFVNALAYWEVDWEKTVVYMSQVYLTSPGLMDSSGWTVAERHRVALYELGNYLVNTNEPCEAVQYYQSSLNIREDANVQQCMANANLTCQAPALTQAAIPTATLFIVVPTQETPLESPTETPPTEIPTP